VTFNDPGDDVTGRHQPRKRKNYKSPPRDQLDAFAGTSTTPQPPRSTSKGERRKENVLATLETQHGDRIAFIRAELKKLYRERALNVKLGETPGVSADDAHKILKANANLGYLDDSDAKPWFGSIFKERGWERTGQWIPSLRDVANSRMIPTWKWTGAYE
jgi:hypothetical protein